ncbi:hypothetical protein LOTGIDRAFT_188884 [Lottia gigantea]|uniref:Uncharacterized protein n=1 Tax=Lottia gigantea TaxID=225164 RepID=V3ZU78_LOTGI|nr:hypothetical protein LOTGIDRAFT_188884 [Lottia gigantea]ESO95038.1 hypothetical protein LOTGIDRAFT_188884 [Lottia gigantea]
MSKGGRAALARSRSIDHQIDEDREKKQKEVQLLLLGGAGSGKSTFIKQLQLHYGNGFPESEREIFTEQILKNVTEGLVLILEQMEILGIKFEKEETEQHGIELSGKHPRVSMKMILSKMAEDEEAALKAQQNRKNADLSPTMAKLKLSTPYLRPNTEMILQIWSDAGVQCSYASRHKFSPEKLTHSEEYFLESIDRITKKNFVPTVQDILYIRQPTLGVMENTFEIDNLIYRVIDVAGQKSLRKKWIHFFEAVTAVMFFVPLSGYDEVLEEDTTMNCLQDSLQAFHEVSHNHYLEKTDMILFLNKKDLFVQKVKKLSIKTCFPKYKGENTPEACLKYIKDQFIQHKPGHKQVYIHVSCAVDVKMMKDILSSVIDIVVEINLRRAGNL